VRVFDEGLAARTAGSFIAAIKDLEKAASLLVAMVATVAISR
jgi:hypothetical protein